MSLFDIIRYPISIPPKNDEIVNLPTSLFKRWMDDNRNSWNRLDLQDNSPRWVETWMRTSWNSSIELDQQIEHDLSILKEMITKLK